MAAATGLSIVKPGYSTVVPGKIEYIVVQR
jgi:hypothetical protein